MEKDSDDIDPPQNLKEWISLFKQLRKWSLLKLESGKIQRGRRGHDVTLVLDCSGRMQGKSFTTMIEAATKYVNGIKQVKMVTSLEDNIGLAVFGGTSGLIVESTSNYDLVLKEISQLRPGGEAPLFGGLLMGLSGVLGSTVSQILENEVPGFIIVFTDKMAGNTSIDKKKEIGIDPLYFIGNAHVYIFLSKQNYHNNNYSDKACGSSFKNNYILVKRSQLVIRLGILLEKISPTDNQRKDVYLPNIDFMVELAIKLTKDITFSYTLNSIGCKVIDSILNESDFIKIGQKIILYDTVPKKQRFSNKAGPSNRMQYFPQITIFRSCYPRKPPSTYNKCSFH